MELLSPRASNLAHGFPLAAAPIPLPEMVWIALSLAFALFVDNRLVHWHTFAFFYVPYEIRLARLQLLIAVVGLLLAPARVLNSFPARCATDFAVTIGISFLVVLKILFDNALCDTLASVGGMKGLLFAAVEGTVNA